MTTKPGWFLFDGLVRTTSRPARARSTGSATACTPARARWRRAPGATAEDDGYVVTFTTDMGRDRSECLVFDAARIADGPIARVRLPERISSGTHSCWMPAPA